MTPEDVALLEEVLELEERGYDWVLEASAAGGAR